MPQQRETEHGILCVKKLQKKKLSVAASALFLALAVSGWSTATAASKRTVCTITVNSPDEKEAFRRHLPAQEYEFVELLERGRSDWLASACRKQVHCDILIVSGHFNGAEFYSDKAEIDDFLPVQEMERASCSASCPGLFSNVKEVYLFGCNTLNPETMPSVAQEIQRNLERAGQSRADAARVSSALARRHAKSIRDVARRIFVNVPAIYGFSSRAPLGPTAASLVDRYFQSSPGDRIGSGSVNRRLLASFAANSMTVVGGMLSGDPEASDRAEACRFVDERLSSAEKLAFIHRILRRDTAEARIFLDEIESFLASLTDADRRDASIAGELDNIGGDAQSADRFLRFSQEAEAPVRVRMIDLARSLGWFSVADHRTELLQLIRQLLGKPAMTTADVDLVCSLGGRSLDDARVDLEASESAADRVDQAAALACLGSPENHQRMLRALVSSNADEIGMAEVYFQHHPISDHQELRDAAASIALMRSSETQARAIDVLAQQHISDTQSVEAVTRLFPLTRSVDVQRAIARFIILADFSAIATPDTLRMLRQTRLKSSGGEDIIDILIRRLEASTSAALAIQSRDDG